MSAALKGSLVCLALVVAACTSPAEETESDVAHFEAAGTEMPVIAKPLTYWGETTRGSTRVMIHIEAGQLLTDSKYNIVDSGEVKVTVYLPSKGQQWTDKGLDANYVKAFGDVYAGGTADDVAMETEHLWGGMGARFKLSLKNGKLSVKNLDAALGPGAGRDDQQRSVEFYAGLANGSIDLSDFKTLSYNHQAEQAIGCVMDLGPNAKKLSFPWGNTRIGEDSAATVISSSEQEASDYQGFAISDSSAFVSVSKANIVSRLWDMNMVQGVIRGEQARALFEVIGDKTVETQTCGRPYGGVSGKLACTTKSGTPTCVAKVVGPGVERPK